MRTRLKSVGPVTKHPPDRTKLHTKSLTPRTVHGFWPFCRIYFLVHPASFQPTRFRGGFAKTRCSVTTRFCESVGFRADVCLRVVNCLSVISAKRAKPKSTASRMNQPSKTVIASGKESIPKPRRVSAKQIHDFTGVDQSEIESAFNENSIPSETPPGETEPVADLITVHKFFESPAAGILQIKPCEIPIEDLKEFHALTSIAPVNKEFVARYVDVMSRGTKMPPLIVFIKDNFQYCVVDGRHRIEAAKKLGWSTILCNVRKGSTLHQTVCAMAANLETCRPVKSREITAKLIAALDYYKQSGFQEPTHRELGALIGVSHTWAGKIKSEMNQKSSPLPKPTQKPSRSHTQKPSALSMLFIVEQEIKTIDDVRKTITVLLESLEPKPALVATALRQVANRLDKISKGAP